MAGLSDRAKLIAELILLDKLSGPARTATGSLGKLESATSRVGKSIGFVGSTISTALGVGLSRAVGAGIGLVESSITSAIEQTKILELAQAQTNAVLKSTGDVAGQTASGIRDLAEKYEGLNATIDDKVIQSGENLLLTFTNIRKDAFEPALQAALDMNQAMGGGAEGLHDTIIRLGKALQDPVRGFTSLRRVGVNITKDQQAQIKALIAQNDLYGAQQIILKELGTEFGGSFAAAGNTAAGSMAALHDAVDDLKISFGTALMPALKNVAGALATTFRDPATLTAVGNLGKGISDFLTPEHIQQGIGLVKDAFKGIVGFAKQVPWEAIGTALQIGGAGARTIMGAFASAPPWLQTAIITGWGLNKLTGGLGSSLFGSLASGLIKGVLGMNAGVVNINAGVVNGAGGLAGAAGGGLTSTLLKGALAVTAGAVIGDVVGQWLNENGLKTPFGTIGGSVGPTKTREAAQFTTFTGTTRSSSDIERAIKSIEDNLNPKDFGAQVALALDVNGVRTTLESQLTALKALLPAAQAAEVKQGAADAKAYAQRATTADSINKVAIHTQATSNAARYTAQEVATTAARTHSYLSKVAADGASTAASSAVTSRKNFSPTIKVTIPITNKVSISTGNVVRTLTSYTAAFGSGQGGAVPNPY